MTKNKPQATHARQRKGVTWKGDRTRYAARSTSLMLCLLPALVALCLYRPSLDFPLMYDTLLHTQLADDVTLASVWKPSEQFGFYRPLVFVPLLAIRALFGQYPATLLHALNVGQHALNAALLAALVWRLWHSRLRALTAGLLFATFPFAYQALAIYGNNAYLTVTGVILLGLHTFLSDRLAATGEQSAGPSASFTHPWLWLTLFLFVAGLLVHELALLLLPFCLLLALTHPVTGHPQPASTSQEHRSTHQSRQPSAFSLYPLSLSLQPSFFILLIAALIYLLIYTQLPTGGGPKLDYGGNAVWPKLLLFMQTAGYPFAWFAHVFPDLSAGALILTSFALTLCLTGLAVWLHRPSKRPLVFGYGWWLGASLLIGLTLPTYYIADGARLLYLGGAGLAVAWAAVMEGLWKAKDQRRGRAWGAALYGLRGTAAVLCLFILVSSGRFVRGMLHDYAMIGRPIQVMQAAVAGSPPSAGVVMVNLPQWVSPPRNTYALGTEFAPLMGDHLFAHELVRVNFGQAHPVYILVEPGLLAETPYHYGVYRLTAVDALPADSAVPKHIFINRYETSGIATDYTGKIVKGERDSVSGPALASIGPYAVLDAKVTACEQVATAEINLAPSLETNSAPPTSPTLSLFVQLLGQDGRLLAQADGPPLGLPPGRYDAGPGIQIIDRRTLTFEAGTPAHLLVGAYDYATGERFPAQDAQGNTLLDNALRLPIKTACPFPPPPAAE